MENAAQYHARHITINNHHKEVKNYLCFAIAAAQASRKSIIMLNKNMDVIYLNDAFCTFSTASHSDIVSIDSITAYLIDVYNDFHHVAYKIKQSYVDLRERQTSITRKDMKIFTVTINTVFDGVQFKGVVLAVHPEILQTQQYTWGIPWECQEQK